MNIIFVVHGVPRPWKRSRTKGHQYFTDPEQQAYQAKVAWCYRKAAFGEDKMMFRGFTGLVSLSCQFNVPDRRVRDLDNLAKNVSDALNGVAFKDDACIWDMHLTKVIDPTEPRSIITIGDFGETK